MMDQGINIGFGIVDLLLGGRDIFSDGVRRRFYLLDRLLDLGRFFHLHLDGINGVHGTLIDLLHGVRCLGSCFGKLVHFLGNLFDVVGHLFSNFKNMVHQL